MVNATRAARAARPGVRALARDAWRAPSRESRDTLFMLAMIGWTVAPHLAHLPLWVTGLSLGVLAWRGWLALRQGALPGKVVILGLLAIAAALTFFSEKTLLSKDSGVTLLVVLMALKTLELRARRDALVVFFLGFFLVLTTFLYSQTVLMALGTGVAVWGWLTALTLAHMPAGRPTIRFAAGLAGRAALVGTPVMIALFLLFPRIGPLWAMPNDAAKTGLSDSLELGNVALLASDDSIALRLKFDGPAPRQDQMYFRGPVLTNTDGHVWRAQSIFDPRLPRGLSAHAAFEQHGRPVTYQMTLEPTQLTWLPMLELTPTGDLPVNGAAAATSSDTAANTAPRIDILDGADLQPLADVDLQWRARRPIVQRTRLRATAWPDDRIVGASPADLRDNLALPAGFFPRTRDWAVRWRDARRAPGQPVDRDAIVESLYRYIGTAGFSYTLSPGAYESDPVDEFWLDRRVGFCEHFATSFVVVLRAMGIPARVVTGYQGADAQPTDGYITVRQSNAHAWAEYWNPARGWVRADPTAAVAPDRIERGQALRPKPGFVGSAIDAVSPTLLERIRALRETVDARWNDWVLGYDRSSQFDMLKKLGMPSPDSDDLGRILILVVTSVALFGAGAAWWDSHKRSPGQRFARKLANSLHTLVPFGLRVAPHESPGSVASSLRQRFSADAEALAALLDAVERQRYGPRAPGAAQGATPWRAIGAAARALAASLRAAGDAPARGARRSA